MKCPECQIELPDESHFCLQCGVPLTPKSNGSAVEHRVESERKRVTALFSDLSGYTAITEKLDPEEVKEIVGSIFNGITEIVQKYEGFIERFAGDGVLALFGVPQAHEDDPIRAIVTAREIHELVEFLSPRYEPKTGQALTMHSGVNTGLVVTADANQEKETHGITGDAINVAARLSDLAAAGEILVGPDTYKAVNHHFSFNPVKPTSVKGKTDPIPIYQLQSVETSVAPDRSGRQVYSAMVGRNWELDRLELQVLKAIDGEGSVVNVIGEAGIGKSRLIAELKKREVMQRVTLLEGRTISIGKNLSFHPIIDLFKNWSMISEDDSPVNAFNKLEKVIRTVHPEETAEILPFVATLMGMKLTGKYADRLKGIEGKALEKLIIKNVRELVIKGSERQPMVLILEDLHWADTSSMEFLEAFYRLAEKRKIVFINAFRPGYLDDKNHQASGIDQRPPAYFVGIEIRPLEKNNSETMIQNMLEIKGLPYAIRDRIVARAGGNPFFIEEVVRSLIDEGAVVLRGTVFEVRDKIDSVVIPHTINDVLIARIDRLEARTRELVKVASVIGRSFFDRVIKEVASSIEDVDGRLAYLKDVQLIRDRTRMQELEHLFMHALVQEAVYASTLLRQRSEVHLKVAQSIENLFKERQHEFYGMLAYHYGKGGNIEKAEEYMTRAGEEAVRSSASNEALHYFREALKLYEGRYGENADREKLVQLKRSLAMASFNQGKYSDAIAYIDDIFADKGYRTARSRPAMVIRAIFDYLAILAFLYTPIPRRPRVMEPQEMEDLALRSRRCQALLVVDDFRAYLEFVSLVRTGCGADLNLYPHGVQWAGYSAAVFYMSGLSYPLAERALKRAEDIVNAQNRPEAMAIAVHRTVYSLCAGLWASAPEFDPDRLDRELRIGNLYDAVLYLAFQAQRIAQMGLFDGASLLADKLYRIGESHDYDQAKVSSAAVRALVAIGKRDLLEAMSEAKEAFLLTDRMTHKPASLLSLGISATAEALLGQGQSALALVNEGETMLSAHRFVSPMFSAPFYVGRLLTHLHLLQEALQSGSRSDIVQIKKEARHSAKKALRISKKYAPHRTWIFDLVGDYHWLIGKQRKALTWYGRSIKEGEHLGARPDLSRTYFDVGKRLLESQSKYKELNGIDAKGYLEKARMLFKEMDLQRDLAELERVECLKQ